MENPMAAGRAQDANKDSGITLERHKQLQALAYGVKGFIDGNTTFTLMESCLFGQMMTAIINLK